MHELWNGREYSTVQYSTAQYSKKGPVTGLMWPRGFQEVRFPDYMTTAQDGGKVVSLMHQPPLPPGNAPGTNFCCRLSRTQGHSVIGGIMSMKNSNDTIWNRTSDLPIRNTAPQPLCHCRPTMQYSTVQYGRHCNDCCILTISNLLCKLLLNHSTAPYFKVQYLAGGDVCRVTWFQEMMAQVS